MDSHASHNQHNEVSEERPQPPTPVVYIIDDDPGHLASCAALVEAVHLEALTFLSPREFLRAHDPDRAGCAIIDVVMPEMSGIELQQALLGQTYVRPHIMLSGYADVPMAVEVMSHGAAGFLTKPYRVTELTELVQKVVGQDVARRERERHLRELQIRMDSLTERERQVLNLMLEGEPNKSIASSLEISHRTVELHRSQVMRKLGAQSLAHLIREVIRLEGCYC